MNTLYCFICWMLWQEGQTVSLAVTIYNGTALCAHHTSQRNPLEDTQRDNGE